MGENPVSGSNFLMQFMCPLCNERIKLLPNGKIGCPAHGPTINGKP